MINWQSILSSFDDKPTLLEWLKKVQKALNESALTTVTVSQEKTGRVNSITLTFNFQDGTKIVAPAFNVQDGVGLNTLADTDLVYGDLSTTYDTVDGLTVYSTMRQTYDGTNHDSEVKYTVPIIGSDTISIDLDSGNNKLVVKVSPTANLTGNINLYRHVIKITSGNAPYNDSFAYLTIISSKNLSVGSLADLKTLLGNTFEYPATGYDLYNIAYVYKVTQDGIIGTNNGGQSVSLSFINMTVFTDTVTTV